MATGLVALSLGVLPDPWHLVGAGFGIVTGWIIFPLTSLERRLRRPGEPFLCGLRTYPIAVFALVLLLPRAEAAAAWGVLAFGDAAAALVGTSVAAPKVFGHPKATWSGSAAYFAVGGLAAWGLSAGVTALGAHFGWVEAGPAPIVAACFAAALAATIADLLPLPPDDNVPAAAAAGGALAIIRKMM